jgi:hypothetical protein
MLAIAIGRTGRCSDLLLFISFDCNCERTAYAYLSTLSASGALELGTLSDACQWNAQGN